MKRTHRGTIGSLLAASLLLVVGAPSFADCQQQSSSCLQCPQGASANQGLTPVAQNAPGTSLQGQTELAVPSATVPSTNVVFQDTIDPAKIDPGDTFQVVTQAPISVNGQVFPAGTQMTGQVIAVQRPENGQAGKVQMIFTGLLSPNGDIAAFARPEDVQANIALAAPSTDNGTFLTRTLTAPYRLGTGALQTVGNTGIGIVRQVGTTTGGVLRNTGGALVDFVTLHPGSGFQKTAQAIVGPFQGLANIVGTTTQGGASLIGLTTGEVTYLVDPSGRPIDKIKAGQSVPITFVQTNTQGQ